MLCMLSRWLISRAEDTGKALPRFAGRHVRGCRACGEFARTATTLSSRLRAERSAWLAEVPDFAVDRGSDATPRPAAKEGPREQRPSWFALRPLPVAAGAAVIVAGALILFQVVLREPAPTAEERAAAWPRSRPSPRRRRGFRASSELRNPPSTGNAGSWRSRSLRPWNTCRPA